MQTQEKHSQAAVLGLQHLLAMYSGSILVPIMIATALGYSAEQLTYLISTDIFMCGVATFLQLQLNKYFGIGLPVVLGVAFQSVSPLIMIGQSHGSGAMFGALIASGIYVVLVSGIFSKVANLFPIPLYFGMPTFEISSIVMMCIIATVSMVESTGVYLALSDITKDPIDSTRLRNGYRAEGLAVLLGGIFNTFPYTGFSQNVGLVKLSGIKKRLPIYYAAGFLLLLGLLPKFGALAQIIPSSVLGGAMLVMFGFVSIQGMQILARVDFANNEHNFLIAAVSIAAGVGLNNSNLFVSMPTAFQMFFSNGIVVASLLAIVLNAVLNHKKK